MNPGAVIYVPPDIHDDAQCAQDGLDHCAHHVHPLFAILRDPDGVTDAIASATHPSSRSPAANRNTQEGSRCRRRVSRRSATSPADCFSHPPPGREGRAGICGQSGVSAGAR